MWPISVVPLSKKKVRGNSAQADDNASVLDAAIPEDQLGPHNANLWQLKPLHHRPQPGGSDDLRIVVQEEQIGSTCLLSAQIAGFPRIEFSGILDHREIVLRLIFRIEGKSLLFPAAGVNDQNFEDDVIGFRADRVDALAEICWSIEGMIMNTCGSLTERPTTFVRVAEVR